MTQMRILFLFGDLKKSLSVYDVMSEEITQVNPITFRHCRCINSDASDRSTVLPLAHQSLTVSNKTYKSIEISESCKFYTHWDSSFRFFLSFLIKHWLEGLNLVSASHQILNSSHHEMRLQKWKHLKFERICWKANVEKRVMS